MAADRVAAAYAAEAWFAVAVFQNGPDQLLWFSGSHRPLPLYDIEYEFGRDAWSNTIATIAGFHAAKAEAIRLARSACGRRYRILDHSKVREVKYTTSRIYSDPMKGRG